MTQVRENLVFHQLDDVAFLDAMSRCRGLMCTAGFESVCEAMYLGKPVYMMPAGRQHKMVQMIEMMNQVLAAPLTSPPGPMPGGAPGGGPPKPPGP